MKKLNFNFKSIVQRKARWFLTLIAILTLGVGQMWATVTIYAVGNMQDNGGTWRDEKTTLYCHNWGSSGTTWPGTKMDKWNDVSVDGHQVFKCNLKADGNTSCIFNTNGGWQTSDVTNMNSTVKAYPYPTYLNGTWYYSPRVCKALWESNQTVSGGYMYFDNSSASWSDTYMYVVVGHATYLGYYRLTALGHTKLYYYSGSSMGWSDAKFVAVAGNSSSKSTGSGNPNNLTTLTHYSDALGYGLNTGSTYMISMSAGTNCTPISIEYNSSGYSGYNYSQTVKKYTSTDGGSTYSAASINSGTVTITPYKLTGNGTVSNSSNTGTLDEASETSVSKDAVYTGEVTVTASANTGYTFVGWFTSASGGSAVSTNTSYTYNAPKSTKTIYARFKENRYDIKVLSASPTAGGSSPSPSSWTATGQITGRTISITANTGYDFSGWTIYSGSGTFADASSRSTTFYPTADSELRPNFTAKTITVTLDKNEGDEDGEATVSYNASSLTSITHASRASYSLNGYYTASSGGSKVINADGSLNNVASWVSGGYWCKATDGTLYAQWTYNPTNYEVTYDVHSSGHGTLSAANTSTSAAISSGDEVTSGTGVTFTASPSTGYTVDGWFSNEACTSPIAGAGSGTTYSTTITAATSVYVKFKEQTWSVAFAAGTGGTVTTPNSTPRTVGQLTGISIAATPSSGYSFSSWSSSSGGSFTSSTSTNSNTFKPTANTTVTASFTPITYTISYTLNGGTNYAGAPTSYNVTTATIVLGTPTKSHYHFDGWTDGNGDPITSIPLGSTGDITLTANWTKLPMVYLKNTMNWANAYVSFYTGNYWEENTSTGGSGSYRTSEFYVADPAAMTYNSANGLFEYECPDLYAYTYACFTKDKQDNYGNFYQTEGIYCNNTMQYDKMVNVASITSSTYNQTKYYTSFTFDTKADGTGWFFPGGWSSWETKGNEGSWNSTNIRWTKSLAANTSYEFKVYNHGVYYGNSGTYSASGSKTFTSGGSNCTLSTTLAGTYTFDYNTSTNSLTISYPAIYAISGGFNSWTEETNLDFTGNDGTYSVSITANNSNYEFKVLENGVWYGHSDKTFTGTESNVTLATSSNNIKLKADIYPSGTYTFAYNKSTHKLGVTYPSGHVVNYGVGDHAGTASVTMSPNIASGKKILDSQSLTFSKGSTATGYTWKGWYSNADGTGTLHSSTDGDYTKSSRSGDFSVYACYNVVNYTITYNLNGGSNPGGAPTGFTIESSAVTLPTPTKTGYTFDGWYENADLSTGGVKTTIPAGSTGNKVYYAKWTPITYTIHFNGNGNTSGSMSDQTGVTYDAATTITANAFVKTGYNFAGWGTTQERANAGTIDRTDGAAHGNLTSTQGATAQLWAVWTPKSCTVTFDYQLSAEGHGNAGTLSNVTATYDATMPALTGNMPTAANGYAFMGFFSETGGNGTKYYNSDKSSAHNWDVNTTSTTTLYAYYKKAEITGVTVSPSTQDPSGTVTATPTISPSPSGETIVCWRLLYSNGNIYPGITFTPGVGNSVTFTAPAASGTYKVATILRTGDACNSGTVLDSVVNTLIVAGSHTVSVQYKDASGNTIQASGSVTGTPTAWSTGITAPTITGYTFHHWLAGDGVTLSENGTSAKTGERADSSVVSPIYIQAIYEGTLTAVYTKKRMIYFYNTLGWNSVYVYFYKNDTYWQTVSPYNGSGANQTYTWTNTPYSEGLHGQMQPISEGSNIYYFDAEAAGVNADYDDVVFTEADQHGEGYFHDTKAVRRGDYKSSLPLFVPLTEQTADVHNRTDYTSNGYWINYPENTGYWLKIYDNAYATKETGAIQSIEFPYSNDLKMPLKLDVEFTDGYNHDYWFMVYRNDGVYMGNNFHFKQGWNDEQTLPDNVNKLKITTSAPGDYKFTLTYHDNGSGVVNYYIDVDYPIATGDYRIYYSDNATWSQGAHTKDAWYHPSHSIAKATTEAKNDTVSFFISKGVGISHTMKFQKASVTNEGVVTWADVAGGSITIPSSITESGVYNFIVSQPAGGASIALEKVEPYTGKYYIRTDCAGNTKWDGFKNIDHEMTYSDYAEAYSGYTHYYAHWVESGTNVKFTIANDYSMCVSDTLIEDYGTTIANISNVGALNSGNASIRFMWDQATNKISRAYISGSAIVSDRFLVLEGDARMYDENGAALNISGLNANEANLIDDQNFVYERTIQVNATARAKLTAKYNDKVQYFKGSAGDFADGTTIQLLGGTYKIDKKYPMRIVYDFKTNRLVTAYMPEGEIDEEIAINADIMLIREHQEAGEQIKFTKDGALSEVKTVYGVMRFNRWTLNNKSKTGGHSALPVGDQKSFIERSLYWISFPFDVNLGDVFGFGTYGTHWILMDYDGAERAKTGYWADNEDGFWKYIWDRRGVTLKAGRGYVLALELDLMKQDNTSFWSNNIEQVELFFPSAENVNNISQTDVNVTVPAHLYDKAAHPTHTDDRTIADSHWNIIGVPSYANYDDELTDGTSTITWRTNNLPFLYEWNPTDNTYTPQSGTTYPFKAMHAYYVQYAGTLHWTLASATPSPVAARRSGKPQSVEMRLELQQNNKMIDQTFVKLSDDEQTSAGFSFGEDLSKEFNATRANLYSLISTTPAAGNTLPMNSDAITYVPLGVKIATAGEYTFAMPAGTSGVGVKLYDNLMSTYTDLSAGFTYTTDLDAGTHDGRFVLEISPIKQVTTGVEEGSDVSGQNGARKVMIDGILYIVKDNKLFDARGVMVK